VPSNISKSRLQKAFTEGRRSATVAAAENPYDNPKLKQLWEQGRTMQIAGEIKIPIPPLEPGKRRAERTLHNPPGSKRAARPAPRPRNSPGFGGRNFRPRGRGM
jgi:hypothetical protein